MKSGLWCGRSCAPPFAGTGSSRPPIGGYLRVSDLHAVYLLLVSVLVRADIVLNVTEDFDRGEKTGRAW